MLKKSIVVIFVICSLISKAQDSLKVTFSGSIKDKETNEALIGATVVVKTGVGTVADLDGNFKIRVPKGDYNIEVSMLGYIKYIQKIKLNTNKVLEIKLESTILDEVEVSANVAQIRETPVAFSSISASKIQEELGGRDISMIANTTPGAYASSSGGGAGDSRVTIRGFDQTNIGVLVDGIPVNDMENGQVYWSNWDGLKDITKSMQIQRGLGASKLAITSVGGTMNFITNGIEGKQQVVVKKEWGNNGHSLIGLSYNSGIINNKWGFTLAGTYKTGDGWVDQTWTNAYSYFAKIQFMPNPRHIISVGLNGAPQSHGQRMTKAPVAVIDKPFAENLGIDATQQFTEMKNLPTTSGARFTTNTQGDRGLQWNPNLGYINGALVAERTNYYNKPLFSINHFWKMSDKVNLSTVLYASFGTGGGVQLQSNNNPKRDTVTGYDNLQEVYNNNSKPTGTHESKTYLVSLNNNHKWFGGLTTLTYKINTKYTFTGGVDLRYYRGFHTTTVYDLLGGNYVRDYSNSNQNPIPITNYNKSKGDIVLRNFDGIVKWGGLFGQGEYKKDKLSIFLTITGGYTGYKRIDYFRKKDLISSDTACYQCLGYLDTVKVQGKSYTANSKEARDATIDNKWFPSYTFKAGSNYNFNEHNNVFVNMGLMSIAPKFANAFNNSTGKEFLDVKNQEIKSFEIGYGLKYSNFNINANVYYTDWKNKPKTVSNYGPNLLSFNINGLNSTYMGFELDGNYKLIKEIHLEAMFGYGDWKYTSENVTVIATDAAGVASGEPIVFSAKNVHVPEAAQTQLSLGIRFMPIKGLYIKPRYSFYDRNYSFLDPTTLNNANANRESWKMPSYYLVDLSAGYEVPFNKFKVNLYGTMNNVLNTLYINDGQNNGYGTNFDAASATVFFGTGRTFTFGTKLTF